MKSLLLTVLLLLLINPQFSKPKFSSGSFSIIVNLKIADLKRENKKLKEKNQILDTKKWELKKRNNQLRKIIDFLDQKIKKFDFTEELKEKSSKFNQNYNFQKNKNFGNDFHNIKFGSSLKDDLNLN